MVSNTCYCHRLRVFDEDTGYELGAPYGEPYDHIACSVCLLEEGFCCCTREERCMFCEERAPVEPTLASKARADENLAEAIKDFQQEYENWDIDRKSGVVPEWKTWSSFIPHILPPQVLETGEQVPHPCKCRDCSMKPGPELDLTDEADLALFRYISGSRNPNHDWFEMVQWYKSWVEKTPEHLNPSAWWFTDTLQLVWNARKLAGMV